MKGLVKVNPKGLIELLINITTMMHDFDIELYKTVEKRFSILKMRKVEHIVYSDCPFWYQYRNDLKDHFRNMYAMAERAAINNDELWLSELSYCNMVMLANGDKHANPIYIMNY
jgi:hypothetical protein